jgi:hypothetical protein
LSPYASLQALASNRSYHVVSSSLWPAVVGVVVVADDAAVAALAVWKQNKFTAQLE